MVVIGELSMWVALLFAAWACIVSFSGGALRRADLTETAERALYMTWGFVVLASIGLWTALIRHDFTLRYVASYTSAQSAQAVYADRVLGGAGRVDALLGAHPVHV